MGVTTKGLWYPDETDNISPLHPVLSSMQSSVDTALSNPINYTPAGIHRVANSGGLTTLLSTLSAAGYVMSSSNPVFAYRADTQILYVNTGSGWTEAWIPTTTTTVGSVTSHRWPNGVQMIAARVDVTIASPNVAASTTIAFPEAFQSVPFPRFSTTFFSGAPAPATAQVISLASASTTGVTVWANRSVVSTISIDVIGVGRWRA